MFLSYQVFIHQRHNLCQQTNKVFVLIAVYRSIVSVSLHLILDYKNQMIIHTKKSKTYITQQT